MNVVWKNYPNPPVALSWNIQTNKPRNSREGGFYTWSWPINQNTCNLKALKCDISAFRIKTYIRKDPMGKVRLHLISLVLSDFKRTHKVYDIASTLWPVINFVYSSLSWIHYDKSHQWYHLILYTNVPVGIGENTSSFTAAEPVRIAWARLASTLDNSVLFTRLSPVLLPAFPPFKSELYAGGGAAFIWGAGSTGFTVSVTGFVGVVGICMAGVCWSLDSRLDEVDAFERWSIKIELVT